VSYPTAGTGPNVSLKAGQSQSLAPGQYGNVTLNPQSTVTLHTGTYYLKGLDLEAQTKVNLDQANGPVIIYEDTSLILRGTFASLTADPPDLLLAYLGTHRFARPIPGQTWVEHSMPEPIVPRARAHSSSRRALVPDCAEILGADVAIVRSMKSATGLDHWGRVAAIVLLGAYTVPACGGSASIDNGDRGFIDTTEPGTTRPHLTPRVWQMTAQVVPSEAQPYSELPAAGIELDYFLDLTQASDIQDFPAKIIDSNSGVTDITVHPVAGGFELDTLGGSTQVGKPDTYTLRLIDSNHDGEIETLSGSTKSTYTPNGEDVVLTVPVDISITGSVDTKAPTVYASPTPVDPLDGVRLFTSEPVQNLLLSLTGPSTVQLTGDSLTTRGTTQILPLGTIWNVAGSGADFSENLLIASGTVSTLRDPGAVSVADFESNANGNVTGSPDRVTAVGSILALNGTHSALLDPRLSYTFHLVSTAPAKTLSLSMRVLTTTPNNARCSVHVLVGFIGNRPQDVSDQLTAMAASTTEDTGDQQWSKASAVQTASITFANPSAQPDALVRISQTYSSFLGSPPPSTLMIDDLKLE